jgi:ribosomal protein S6--L-glutamate ligase
MYYHRHHCDIIEEFQFPFIAKLPRASSRGRGVFKITSEKALKRYLPLTKVAYIQEFLPHDRDLRVVLVNFQPIIAYWRVSAPGNFKTNLFQGGTIEFDNIPPDVLKMARDAARKCNFDDVGLDFIHHQGKWYLIEANTKYGRRALREKGMDLKKIIWDSLSSPEQAPKT